jgi:hypothetical protein
MSDDSREAENKLSGIEKELRDIAKRSHTSEFGCVGA